MLSPQHKEAPPILVYYHELANRELIRNVFLMFIREIESEFSDLIIKSNNLAFHPSTISVDGFDEDDRKYELEQIKHKISTNTNALSLSKASHLVVKAGDGHNLSDENVELLNLVESIDEEQSNDRKFSTTNVMAVKFETIQSAIGKIK
tara:strand:- start:665 stop:1111 length:447 start_codon:yes stop_codon:yes gene_type:complete